MKANSERVKGKNFREFAGKPLFRWILESLLSVDAIDRVVINTDARQVLADHGLEDGAENGRVMIRDRKPEICGDLVSMNLVLADDVENVPAKTYLMTHTTNPLLTSETIASAIEQYSKGVASGAADSLFTVNPIQTRFYRADGSAINHDPDNLIRTQDLELWLEENSNLYVFNKDSFAKTNARIGASPILFQMDSTESIDIDDQAQWELAEAVALYKMGATNG
ncbi:MAG: acylneuraminate cytidylyltransferase family protein [Altererythrobacter sp.]|nr:acylneuraminate cytidylyltransferase family protein [Altererythrobacter sp.]MBO6642214.1 acylneuraminate cytidylyltransferase family protein [Altererythrobacter sp.]MBO6709278.1 acylneuraminate cytidylyltransferase family protein [Altererythrobacter sp.]